MNKKVKKFWLILSGVLVFFTPSIVSAQSLTHVDIGTVSTVVKDVLYIRPFKLDKGYPFYWHKDQPIIDSGTIIVVAFESDLVRANNVMGPILYAGDRVIQPLNLGRESKRIIAIIPKSFDFDSKGIWYGLQGVPVDVTPESIARAKKIASQHIHFVSKKQAKSVTHEEVQVDSFSALLKSELADLVLQFSPQEKRLAQQWKLPDATIKKLN